MRLCEDVGGHEAELQVTQAQRDLSGPGAAGHRRVQLSEHEVGDGQERLGLAASPIVVQPLGESFRLAHALDDLSDFAELVEGRPQLESNVEGLLQRGTALREAAQRGQCPLEAGHRLALGVPLERSGSRAPKMEDGPVPGLPLEEVPTEGEVVRLRIVGVQCRESLCHPTVKRLAARCQDLAIGHLAHPVVREVETLAHGVEQAPADQPLHLPRHRLLAAPGRLVQEGKFGLAPHHGGQRDQLAALFVQAVELAADDVADALRHRQRLETWRERLVRGGAHRLDDDEGIALAGAPDLRAQVSHGVGGTSSLGQHVHEMDGVRLRERPEVDRVDVGLARQLGESALEQRRIRQLLLTRRDHDKQWPAPEGGGR